ncbi:MAG: DUF3343 domain-containing protein [Mogibacterium sp.]|nr:DUF3343 domain-containing protein [Mogibacterium sp.]
MDEYYLLTFESTHAAISTEKLLKPADVSIMPVPRFISASCGISIRIYPSRRMQAEQLFKSESPLRTDEYAYYHIQCSKSDSQPLCTRIEL